LPGKLKANPEKMNIIIITIAILLITSSVFAGQKEQGGAPVFTNADLEERTIPSEPQKDSGTETKVKYDAEGRRIEISREILLPRKNDKPQNSAKSTNKSPEDPAASRKALEALLKQKWQGMITALLKGEIETVLSYFTPGSRDQYRSIFSRYNAYEIKTRFAGVYDLTLENVDGSFAQCQALRKEEGETNKYPVRFVRLDDGNWMIEGL
jgi:hypothetical protein